tara:strand:- start:3488 stop:4903 length:1416 start_codon:yes stop_codon:yes gene_type:complete
MSLVNIQNSETIPVNGQSEYSSSGGSYNLEFQLSGSENMMCDLNSLRICAQVDYLNAEGKHVNNNNIYMSGVRDGAGAPGLPALVHTNAVFNYGEQPFVDVDNRTGCNMLINSILFEDSSNNTLENVTQFGHLCNKVNSMTMSQDDMMTWGGSTYGVKSGGKTLISQQAINSTQDICLKLYSGLSQSAPLPYSAIRGRLNISVQLQNSSAVFHGADNLKGGRSGSDRAVGCFYRLKNVKMIYRNLILDEPAPILKSGYSYRHFSSLQSTISASNNTNIYQPNSSNAISIITSFIPSQNLNNYQKNSVQSGKLKNRTPPTGTIYPNTLPQSVNINSVDLLKNNINFPLSFPINESVYTKNNNNRNNYETQRSYYYLSTLKPFNSINHSLISPSTEDYGSYYGPTDVDTFPVSAGVGIRYSMGNNDGTSYTGGASFQQRIDSGLNSTLNNEMMSNILSTKRIVISQNGPVILN